MSRRSYETYIAPEDPFISQDEFDALDYNGKGEAIMHLSKAGADGKAYALDLLNTLSDTDATVVLVAGNHLAGKFFPPANPQKGELPAGMPDITPDRPTMRAVISAPSARRK